MIPSIAFRPPPLEEFVANQLELQYTTRTPRLAFSSPPPSIGSNGDPLTIKEFAVKQHEPPRSNMTAKLVFSIGLDNRYINKRVCCEAALTQPLGKL